ncbi:hypothetical protein U9M48_002576 [Paspalum notatum var. saurae]|uniref:Uncharacterized protein n=1 Tax=Paspalum notatum var. saurae TaxID=547442 RepID=A0AAQ3SDK1_PASNO
MDDRIQRRGVSCGRADRGYVPLRRHLSSPVTRHAIPSCLRPPPSHGFARRSPAADITVHLGCHMLSGLVLSLLSLKLPTTPREKMVAAERQQVDGRVKRIIELTDKSSQSEDGVRTKAEEGKDIVGTCNARVFN